MTATGRASSGESSACQLRSSPHASPSPAPLPLNMPQPCGQTQHSMPHADAHHSLCQPLRGPAEVTKLMGARKVGGVWQFLVRWAGYNPAWDDWVTCEALNAPPAKYWWDQHAKVADAVLRLQ